MNLARSAPASLLPLCSLYEGNSSRPALTAPDHPSGRPGEHLFARSHLEPARRGHEIISAVPTRGGFRLWRLGTAQQPSSAHRGHGGIKPTRIPPTPARRVSSPPTQQPALFHCHRQAYAG